MSRIENLPRSGILQVEIALYDRAEYRLEKANQSYRELPFIQRRFDDLLGVLRISERSRIQANMDRRLKRIGRITATR